MEEEGKKLNFVSNGVTKLPPGFQFEPTDEEIVFDYLKCKALGLHLPAAVIPDINVFEYDPWDLPGELEKDKYFFCSKKMNVTMSSKARACSGYWKSTGEEPERVILRPTSSADNRLVGVRKTMSFYKGNMSENKPIVTEWRMHEYHLMTLLTHSSSSADSKCHHQLLPLGGWSICHILKKTKKKKNKCDLICYSSMKTLNKRTREGDIDDDSSNDGLFKLSKIDVDGGKGSSASSCCSWSSGSSVRMKCSSDDTQDSSSSSSSSSSLR